MFGLVDRVGVGNKHEVPCVPQQGVVRRLVRHESHLLCFSRGVQNIGDISIESSRCSCLSGAANRLASSGQLILDLWWVVCPSQVKCR